MRSRLLVVRFAELPHKLLEYVAHIRAGDLFGIEVGFLRAELRNHEIKQVVVLHLLYLVFEFEIVDYVDDVVAETLKIRPKVVRYVELVGKQFFKRKSAGVVKQVSRRPSQKTILDFYALGFQFFVFRNYGLFCRRQRIAETLYNAHWQYNFSVFVRFVNAHQFVGYRPNKVGFFLYVYRCLLFSFVLCHVSLVRVAR